MQYARLWKYVYHARETAEMVSSNHVSPGHGIAMQIITFNFDTLILWG